MIAGWRRQRSHRGSVQDIWCYGPWFTGVLVVADRPYSHSPHKWTQYTNSSAFVANHLIPYETYICTKGSYAILVSLQ